MEKEKLKEPWNKVRLVRRGSPSQTKRWSICICFMGSLSISHNKKSNVNKEQMVNDTIPL